MPTPMILPFFLFIVGVLVFIFALSLLRRFDTMLYAIYDTDRDRWEKLGRPMGYNWHPKEKTPFFHAMIARDTLFFSFLVAGLKDPALKGERT